MRRILFLVVALLLVCSVSFAKTKGWKSGDSEKYLSWWDKKYQGADSAVIGAVLYQKEDYQAAIAELEKSIQAGSKDGKTYYQLAYSYQQLGNTAKAIELYKEAIKLLDSTEPEHRYDFYSKYNLALLEKDSGNIDDAVLVLKEAVLKFPDEPGARNLLGWLYWKQGNKEAAINEYATSVGVDSNQEDAQYNLGVLYYNKGDTENAKAAFEKVLAINPNHTKASSYILNLGNKNLLSSEEYSSLDMPDPALRHCYLGKKNLDEGKYAEAREEYEAALEINWKTIEAQQGLAVAYEYNDKGERYGDGFNIKKCIFHYEKALLLNPKLEQAVYNLGVLYSKDGKVDEAVNLYLRLIREMPDNAQAHYNLAVLYDNQTKNKERAIYHYSRFIDLDPENPKRADIEQRIRKLRV